MTAPTPQAGGWVDKVLLAVLNTSHTINAQKIVLEYDRSKPGHNATNQLHLRIEASLAAQAAITERLADALKEERRLRLLGQSPECGQVHWESLRDMRRASYEATDAALDAHQKGTA